MTLGQTLAQKLEVSEEVYRRNFFFFLIDGVLFTVALNIMGPTTIIPDFVRRLTDSEIIIGVSSSIFSIGYTLPQIFVARLLVNKARKKWWFIVPNIPTRFVVLIFSLFIWFRFSLNAHTILILFLATYTIAALGDGLVGVPWADLTGSSLNERWRARFYGFMSAGSGIIMLAAAPLIALVLGSSGLVFPQNYAAIFGFSGVLFVISILPVIFVHEVVDTKPRASVPPPTEYVANLAQFIRHDRSYRRILSAQILTSLYLMAMPFYIGFGTTQLSLPSETAVPILLVMQTIGNIAGAVLYAWLGAKNNLLYIRLALAAATILPLSAIAAPLVGELSLYIGFLISGTAISNLMFGYQNWIITHAPPEDRPLYVGLSNTVISVVSLLAPIIGGAIVQSASYIVLFTVAAVMVLLALFTLPTNPKLIGE